MTDMPDTTLTGNPSHHQDAQETDDAAGYATDDLTYPSYTALWRALTSRPAGD